MDSPFWHPKPGIVYRPWSEGGEHSGKSAEVKIHLGTLVFDGTFSVQKDSCVVHILRKGHTPTRALLPKGAYKIRKETRKTIRVQPVLYWTTIMYEVFVDKGVSIHLS